MFVLTLWTVPAAAHELRGHSGPTYEITKPGPNRAGRALAHRFDNGGASPTLRLSVLDHETGKPAAARFSLIVDGEDYTPDALGEDGLRFVSIHAGRKQRFIALYTRGSGIVEVPLPVGAKRGTVHLAKGLEYLPGSAAFEVAGGIAEAAVTLRRWTDIRSKGWLSVEEHLHYDRTDPAHDRDWLTILAGDDLAYGHFLVLKGGNLADVWATQYAYGQQGRAGDGDRLICPGEEYRDIMQGHINLLGVKEVIQPIQAGTTDHPYNYPALYDVFKRARELGGLGGPAHGTKLGRSPTGISDTILGAVDFFEIANTHIYKTDVWYRLMNCGCIVPPAAGTDLPNYQFRDSWQPLLGEVRTYVNTGGKVDFEAFKQAVREGKTFISSGPMISLSVDGVGPGGTVRLPEDGAEVLVTAELSGPRPLQSFDIVVNGEPVAAEIDKSKDGPVHRWRIAARVQISRSSWLAARGEGVAKAALEEHTSIAQNTIAHTAAVRVLLGDKPIESAADADFLIKHIQKQIELYRSTAKYENPQDKERALGLFQSAIGKLEQQLD